MRAEGVEDGPLLFGPRAPEEWVAYRSDVFRAAYALVASLNWGDAKPEIIEVLRVAEFLSEGEDG